MSDGSVIGIDFGAAFGLGIQLQVPELMPIRYTRQFRHLFHPLDTDSLLKQDMVHSLSALSAAKHQLLSICSVFINEPSVDWVHLAQQGKVVGQHKDKSKEHVLDVDVNSDMQDGNAVFADVAWYPMKKLAIVRYKLSQYNPASIMSTEIKDNRSVLAAKNGMMERCLECIQGTKVKAKRATAGKQCESVEQQLDFILEQSTDPNILGRTWQGWAPFL